MKIFLVGRGKFANAIRALIPNYGVDVVDDETVPVDSVVFVVSEKSLELANKLSIIVPLHR